MVRERMVRTHMEWVCMVSEVHSVGTHEVGVHEVGVHGVGTRWARVHGAGTCGGSARCGLNYMYRLFHSIHFV